VGGCACNTSIALARLDKSLEVTAIGRIGEDGNGHYIREVLEQNCVSPYIITDKSLPTSFTDVMSEVRGERTFFHARGANAAFCYEDIPFNKLDCDLFHIGYILLLDSMDAEDAEYGTVFARTLARVRSMGIKTSIDVVSENSNRFSRLATPSLKYCDYVIINENEASLITGLPAHESNGSLSESSIRKILERLMELGVQEMAAIHTPEGGWALSRSKGYAFSPSINIPAEQIKGHVGAGDSFCAGLLYGICKGFELQYALEIAAGTAACNLTAANSTDGLRDFSGISDAINQWGFRK
jgi:sugar/nucleoside kinase (ribokinase family)